PNGSWFINASGGPTASAGLVLPGGGVVWFDATAALLPLPGLLLPLGPGGFGSMPAALPAGVGLQGLSLWVQTLIVDPLNPSAVILSNGLQVVVGP
ncbi:MAG: hypothetical protein ACE5F1_20950, partial [Planctomycetota bacterium]